MAVIAIWLGWQGPAFSFAGSSLAATVAEVGAGLAVVVAGAWARRRRPDAAFGLVFAVAGICSFLVEWPNPAAAAALVFTIGLVVQRSGVAVLANAALLYPDQRLESTPSKLVAISGYAVNIGLIGLLPALVLDPSLADCTLCPDNLLSSGSDLGVAMTITRLGLAAGIVWGAAFIGLIATRIVRSTQAARRRLFPVLAPAGLSVLAVIVDAAHSLSRGSLSNDPIDVLCWYAQLAGMVGMAAGVLWEGVRARRSRQRIARFSTELIRSRTAGGLRIELAAALGDPSLAVAYALPDGQVVDVAGKPINLDPPAGRSITRVERGGGLCALIEHREDVAGEPDRLAETVAVARLSLENERLNAGTSRQLADLLASRQRIVEAGETARRRLERDLHDGAQQQLVTLAIELRLQREKTTIGATLPELEQIVAAEHEVRQALGALREIAHGIYPAELAEAGLPAALEVLADITPVALDVLDLPGTRLDPIVESTAYFVIAQTLERPDTTWASVSARSSADHLVIDVESDGPVPANLVELEDRVGALGGSIAWSAQAVDRVRVHAEIPCAS